MLLENWVLCERGVGTRLRLDTVKCRFLAQNRSQMFEEWWNNNNNMMDIPADQKCIKAAVILYMIWSIWKERKRGISEQKQSYKTHVLLLIKEMSLQNMACGEPAVG